MRQFTPKLPRIDEHNHNTADSEITCPSCGDQISLSGALRAQYAEKFEEEFKQKDREASALIKQKEEVLAKRNQQLEKEFAEKMSLEKASLEKRFRDQLTKTKDVEVEDLKNQLNEKDKRLSNAIVTELELRKRARDLEEKEKEFELELLKKVEAEKARLEEDISKRVLEDQRLKMAEKDKQLNDMHIKIEDLKRKSELTSQQLQGEVLELELETILIKAFPADSIEPVAKGIRGGDINHKIISSTGQQLGTIVWETKRAKHWSESWIDKIKEDQRQISAEFAVIVSDILPKGITSLSFHDGVWVCDTKSALGLGMSLRHNLIRVCAAKASVAGKDAKMELMHRYVTGTQFIQSVQAMAEVLKDMKSALQDEKRAYIKIWARREKQIDDLAFNVISVYGSVQGIVGGALPVIETLELSQGNND